MTRDLQNIRSRTKKILCKCLGYKQEVKIVKFESKKNVSRERENADQLCCQSMPSLN